MTKTYYSGCNLAFSVYSKKCPNVRIHFEPTGTFRYVFSTSNKDLIEAIEKHEWFNEKFFIWTVEEDQKPVSQEETTTADVQEAEEYNEVNVCCLSEAKEYLADNFGVSRTQLRTKASIDKSAETFKIKFVYTGE